MLATSVLLLVALSVSANPTPRFAGPNYWFSFGDSYTMTGFDPSSTLPSDSNPIGNPPFPGLTITGSVTYGSNWIGASTVKFNQSQIFTYNYAYGGATIDAKLVPPYRPDVLSMTDQVNQFLNGAGKKPASTPWISANSMFSVWIGINDIGGSFYWGGDRFAFSDTLLNAEFALVEKLYAVGARNFLFLNVPPIYRSPLMLAGDQWNRDTVKAIIPIHNQKYAAKIAAFRASHPGVRTWLWDGDASFNKILDSPTSYGFKDATSYDQVGSFWGDDYHPGSLANDIFAREVDKLLRGTIW